MRFREFEDSSAAAGHASQRIVGDERRQPGLFHDQFIDVAQQCTTTCKHDTALRHIAAEIRRRLLERLPHRTHDNLQWFLESLPYFVRVQRERTRDTFREVSSPEGDFTDLLAGIGRTDFNLYALCGGLADQNAVVAADVLRDRFVELVPAHAHARRVDDAVQGDNGDFRSAGTDVEDHRAACFVHRQPCADGGGHGFRHDIDSARAGTLGGFFDGSAFDLGCAERHAYEYARTPTEKTMAVNFVDEVLKHLFGVR